MKKNNIFFFISADCPLCVAYEPVIRATSEKYKNEKDWNVFLVREDGISEHLNSDFSKMNQIDDSDHKLAHDLGATVTPEVFIADDNGKILYHGAIDNYAIETGKHRIHADAHYMRDALHALGENKKPQISKTPAVGCYIE